MAVLSTLSGPIVAQEARVQLKFAFSTNNPDERTLTLEQVQRFESEHPELDVELLPRLWEGYGIFDSYVRFLALQDPSVDIYLVDLPWIPEFVAPGWLLPLDDLVDQQFLDELAPNALTWGSYDGRLYGIPWSYKANMLFYRSDLLAAHGLEPPRTLDALATAARSLQHAERMPIGLALHGMYFHNDVFAFFFANGGSVLDADGALVLDSERNQQTLRWLVDAFAPSHGQPPFAPPLALFDGPWGRDYQAPVRAFAAGEAPFLVAWSANWRDLQRETSQVRGRVGVSAVPGFSPQSPGGSNHGTW